MILKHLFLRPEILGRLIFSQSDGQTYYVQATSQQKARRALPEEIIRQLFVLSLLHDYKYPEGLIRLEFPIQMGREKKRADIVVLDASGNVKIIIEVKAEHDKDAMSQLNSYMAITGAIYGAIVSGIEISCVKRLSAQDVQPINDLPIFLENDTWTEPEIQAEHNPQPGLSATPGASIEVEGFERNTPTHAKITIKGQTLELSNVELESYKKLRQKFLVAGIALNPNIKQAEWFEKFSQLLEDTPVTYSPLMGRAPIWDGVAVKKVMEALEEAIEQGQPGFAGGWISSFAFDNLLDNIRAEIPRNMRKEMLYALGYIWHPRLHDGRINNTINDVVGGLGKPKLFIKKGHLDSNLTSCAEIVRAYLAAQIPKAKIGNGNVDEMNHVSNLPPNSE